MKPAADRLPGDKLITAYVTVSIPIGLAYDQIPGKDQRWNDALANFIDHPALKDAALLEGYVQRVEFEEAETKMETEKRAK